MQKCNQVFPPAAKLYNESLQQPVCIIDEFWSFCRKKGIKIWFLAAYDYSCKKIIALVPGNRSNKTIRKLFLQLPDNYRNRAKFYTDNWRGFRTMLPSERLTQSKRYTYLIESAFCALRQRQNRVARKTVGFSKSIANHIAAVKFSVASFNNRFV